MFRLLDPEDARKLGRARLQVIDAILGIADQYNVAAVLGAGDLFDTATPDAAWWKGLVEIFSRKRTWSRPVILLPGNHDPLTPDSVYSPGHPFRQALPKWVHVVDRDRFELELSPEAVLYASPCRSTAGADDLAMSLPERAAGDTRVRIGLVHGTTFDVPGHQANFPISREATRARGLDYLAVGDTHGFREIPEGALAPIVYPSAPEPTSFSERDAGYVAVVSFRRSGERLRIRRERVAHWSWREVTVRSIVELRALAAEDLGSTVLRLRLDLEVASIAEHDEVETIITGLKGTAADFPQAGALLIEKKRFQLAPGVGLSLDDAPDSVKEAAARLGQLASTDAKARQALMLLHRLMREVG